MILDPAFIPFLCDMDEADLQALPETVCCYIEQSFTNNPQGTHRALIFWIFNDILETRRNSL